MTINDALAWAKKLLKEKNVEGPESSAEFLLRQTIHQDKAYLFTHSEHKMTLAQQAKYRSWVTQRSKHKPVWYITAKIDFLGLDFSVNQNVLIPRPETELLVEKITEHFREGFSPKSILDIGTGSGAIILSLANICYSSSGARSAHICSNSKLFASDISQKALAVARKNAKNLGFAGKVCFKKGDLFQPWQGQKFDLIVANLPYIPHEDMATLAVDLIHYEPRTALDGGHEGLEIYERFFAEIGSHLNGGGKVFCEIGYDQGERIQKILAQTMLKASVTVLGDYANVDRIVVLET